jgi:putative CocE/NonD family hydrolase
MGLVEVVLPNQVAQDDKESSMRTLALFLAVLVSGALITDARAQIPDSLPAGWRRFPSAAALATASFVVEFDREVKHGGLASLRIRSADAPPGQLGGVAQRILATDFRGRRLRLTGYMRVDSAGQGAGLYMRVDGSANGTAFDNMSDRQLTGTADWQRLEVVLDVPADAGLIDLGVLLAGTGTAWVDDLDLSVVDSSVPTTGQVIPYQTEVPLPLADLPRSPRNLDLEDGRLVAGPPVRVFQRQDTLIAMRDGVRLFTAIVLPRGTSEPLPILLTRTPYGAFPYASRELIDDGYIIVSQDIRGRGRSEGTFVMNRPMKAPHDSAAVDETTDAYDTVEWLIRNVPNNNGRVGVRGVSYPGWTAEVVLLGPHPAVRTVSPQAPMTDTWMGDDFFHQGAFRLSYGFGYSYNMERELAGLDPFPEPGGDPYDWYLAFSSLKALTDSFDLLRVPTWRRFVEHPAYDSEWQGRAFQRLVTGLSVPTLTVGGWWDSEDLFGPQATYAALERLDSAGVNHLVIGPWSHGQWLGRNGARLGDLSFGSATADSFRVWIEAPWFAFWLKGRGDGRFPEAWLFDAGTNEWHGFDRWPPHEAVVRNLHFYADGRLSFDPPAEQAAFDEYVSDPADPVPYQQRPVGRVWAQWMTEDQRFAGERPDVLSWRTEPLEDEVTIAGNVTARLFASTTGSDADWVVKLIDVFPDSVPDRPEMDGYQLMVAGDIMRGRYRRSWENPEAIRSGAVELYTVDLHQQYYTFQRGHRIMVQVQSTWFPLYDRNPQTWVPNIFHAPASAYQAQTHRIHRTAAQPSHVEVMVLPR